ncbi:MAG: amidohydrolase family protein, partial [Planctomycetota bacterium]
RLMASQVENLYRNVVLPSKGRIHPFVAFDPARELAYRNGVTNPDGKPEEHGSLNLVKDAIENKGFIGVKVYNAMGYKPIHNVTVEAHRRRLPLHDSKYRFSGADYDAVLSELYLYCVENEVPITAHCFMDGMESYPDASWDFGQARFWRDVLDREAFRNLRLNLAHFGWNKDQRYDGDRSWVRDICAMLPRYPHLYTDSAHHRVILDDKRDSFKEDYREICAHTPLVKKRLLFGIDWHVVKRVRNFENFKTCYREVLEHNSLFSKEELADFFGGNALRFLGLGPGERNRARLERFYADEGIDPPPWFVAAGEGEQP